MIEFSCFTKQASWFRHNIWDMSPYCCPSIMVIILDTEWGVVSVIDKDDGICVGKSWEDEATDLFQVVNAPVDWAILQSEPSRFLASQSSCVGVARCQIIPMSIWTTFRTAPYGGNICSDAKVRLVFLWIVAVRGLVFVKTLFWCKVSTWTWSAYCSPGVVHKSWQGDQSRMQWPQCWREDAKGISIKIMNGCLEVRNCLPILLHPHWLTLNILHMKMLAFEVLLHNNLHSCNVVCIPRCCKQLIIVQNLHPPLLELWVVHSCLNPKVKWLTGVVQPCHWLDKMVTDEGHFFIGKCREHSPIVWKPPPIIIVVMCH